MVVLPHALCREIGGIRRRDERLDALAPDEVQELLAPLDVSSLMTSSSSRMGYSPVSERRNSSSASFSESTPVRCCPCEPKVRRLMPLTVITMSS